MKNRTTYGFTLVEIMIVVAILGLLAAIAVPNFIDARAQSQKRTCVANLERIQRAVSVHPSVHLGATNVVLTDLFPSETDRPVCPAGGVYTVGTLTVPPACSLANGRFPHVLLTPTR